MPSLRKHSSAILGALWLATAGCTQWISPNAWQDPLTIEEHALLGDTYLRQGELKPAAREYAVVVTKDPQHVPALLALGNIAFHRQEWAEAEAYYRRVLATDAKHAGAANNLAMVFVSTGDHLDEAEHLARHALAQSGSLKPYIQETLATLYMKQGRWTEAEAAVEAAAASRDPDHLELQNRLAELRHHISTH